MGKPYRKASRQTLVWLVLCLCGVAGQIALMMSVPAFKTMGMWQAFLLGSIPFFIGLTAAVIVTSRLKRRRFRRLADKLVPMGFDFVLKPEAQRKQEFFAPFEPLRGWLNLPAGPDGIEWLAARTGGHGEVRVFEYEFVTGTGKTTQIHMRTILAFPASRAVPVGCTLGHLAGFRASRISWWFRRSWKRHSLQDPAFHRLQPGWAFTGDADTGRRLVNDAVAAELKLAPVGESWYIGGGWVFCVYENPLEPDHLIRFMDRAWTVFSLAG